MIVRFAGGPLAGRELETTDAPWAGDWLTAGDADWALYVPVHHDQATDTVLAEVRVTIPRGWQTPIATPRC
ncbi:hypothetical protein KVH22_37330 [Streptomyces olivaceus]|uniref:hypothetical protein n=1 Tax=Streptomyces TaxID=1883 RepID=UPI0018A86358|nr:MULTISPECIES: hypothetical protein [Streptomyces]MBF8175960.1 hypothetical protein [Streptomyces olivaceus]MBZ6261175.1 hypothetical protein [Streptomyces olivaceus]UOG81050.1 hypothetical protein L6J92_18405 [Streptomyces sp. CB09030]UOG81055.1 hypothetical protein L6J92_18440 [Streptomyces sp. CB09030]